MANIKSAKKRILQNEKRRIRNSRVKSSIRTSYKKVYHAIEGKEEKDIQKINELFKDFIKKIDTASGKGIIHWKTAARKKSRLAKRVNSLTQQS
ncbi:MAG: 30S ribosomal protein S20 [Spirochaetota bacterium]|nr:30S ribosomal protein S20 [Spirochaetota bacterium]